MRETTAGGVSCQADSFRSMGDRCLSNYAAWGRQITSALEQVRQYFRNYAAWLGVDLSYQHFDDDMASLPGAYDGANGPAVLCRARRRAGRLRWRPPLPDSEGVGEMKRLYVDAGKTWPRCRAPSRPGCNQGRQGTGLSQTADRHLAKHAPGREAVSRTGFQAKRRPITTRPRSKAPCSWRLDLENWSEDEVK